MCFQKLIQKTPNLMFKMINTIITKIFIEDLLNNWKVIWLL